MRGLGNGFEGENTTIKKRDASSVASLSHELVMHNFAGKALLILLVDMGW